MYEEGRIYWFGLFVLDVPPQSRTPNPRSSQVFLLGQTQDAPEDLEAQGGEKEPEGGQRCEARTSSMSVRWEVRSSGYTEQLKRVREGSSGAVFRRSRVLSCKCVGWATGTSARCDQEPEHAHLHHSHTQIAWCELLAVVACASPTDRCCSASRCCSTWTTTPTYTSSTDRRLAAGHWLACWDSSTASLYATTSTSAPSIARASTTR